MERSLFIEIDVFCVASVNVLLFKSIEMSVRGILCFQFTVCFIIFLVVLFFIPFDAYDPLPFR